MIHKKSLKMNPYLFITERKTTTNLKKVQRPEEKPKKVFRLKFIANLL